jgi:murein L,D-transpeptidase YcbB/YkuD
VGHLLEVAHPYALLLEAIRILAHSVYIDIMIRKYVMGCLFILLTAMKAAAQMAPDSAEYKHLENWCTYYQNIVNDKAFKEVGITSLSTDDGNWPLFVKLYQLGIIEALDKKYSANELKEKIKVAQYYLGVTRTGVLNEETRTALNVPLRKRLAAVQKAMIDLRVIYDLQLNGPVVVINIPSATLQLYENNRIILESKLVVGRPSTPTPEFTGVIHEVILFPWYIVPKNIAVKEALPRIKNNTQYIEDNNLQVLNDQGQAVNPYTINWHAVKADSFPYTLRQSTICDNGVGSIKFNFQNLVGVYLHDTPWTVLFKMHRRYLSRGCLRMEKAMELARYILKDSTSVIDSLKPSDNLVNPQPVTIPASVKVPVYAMYNTAWFDAAGTIRFYEDVYNKN